MLLLPELVKTLREAVPELANTGKHVNKGTHNLQHPFWQLLLLFFFFFAHAIHWWRGEAATESANKGKCNEGI